VARAGIVAFGIVLAKKIWFLGGCYGLGAMTQARAFVMRKIVRVMD
jgi:hypothetical protein